MKAEQWSDNEIRITDSYLYRESIKEISGRRYDTEVKAWFVPLTVANVELLKMLGAELGGELAVMVQASDADGKAEAADEEPVCPMPISITPYKHQIRGFNRCMENDGYGLLFQVGLGKSATAITADGCFSGA